MGASHVLDFRPATFTGESHNRVALRVHQAQRRVFGRLEQTMATVSPMRTCWQGTGYAERSLPSSFSVGGRRTPLSTMFWRFERCIEMKYSTPWMVTQ
jgi:hypothetical protein